jgi:UDP-N-acetylmuramyl-tripeptide synthetase
VSSSRSALAILSNKFFGYPSKKLKLIGITGTNGKTTTSYFCESIFKEAGYKTGVVGTLCTKIGEKVVKNFLTTPESYDLQEILSIMVKENIEYVIMEVSSHALSLERVKGCEFRVGIFTNLTQDHLDFHKNFEEYKNAKLKLFTEYANLSKEFKGVINVDDENGRFFTNKMEKKYFTYGIKNKADITGENLKFVPEGTEFFLKTPKNKIYLKLKLKGIFNLYNALAASGAAVAENIEIDIIKKGLEKLEYVPGRLEEIKGENFSVFVDYAHTPDGLYNILLALREISKGKIILVFGCGGDRDRKKRPIMGEIAAKLSDYFIITSDNPRSEDPEKIIKEIEEGVKNVKGNFGYEIEIDRETAIRKALKIAKKNDTVIIAGKGHEDYQIFKDRIIHFDDREVVKKVLKEIEK